MSATFLAAAIPIAAAVVLVLSTLIGFGVALGMRLESAARDAHARRRELRRPALVKESA